MPSTSQQQALKEEKHSEERSDKHNTPLKKSPESEDTIEKVRANVQNLQRMLKENREASSKSDLSQYFKSPDHTPKIVEVIPKACESKPKEEIRIIPIQIETKKDVEPTRIVKESTHTPIIIKENIVIHKKPIQNVNNDKSEIKPDKSSPKILTSIEVKPKIQYVFPSIQNSYQDQFAQETFQVKTIQVPTVQQEVSTQKPVQSTSSTSKTTVEVSIQKPLQSTSSTSKTTQQEISTQKPAQSTSSSETTQQAVPTQKPVQTSLTTSASKQETAQTLNTPSTLTEIRKVETTEHHPSAIPQKAKEEDFEEYDFKTLKPSKEWECHMCTLLNPVTSNVCAVCRTMRLQKEKPQSSRKKKKAPQPTPRKDQTYRQLMDLDNTDLVGNAETFDCVICFLEVAPGEGVTLRECLHQFCKPCLAHTIEFSEEAEVKCPYMDDDYACNLVLQDREIKALVTLEVYEQHLAKSVAQAENKIDKSFHCKTPDCKGWCIFEDNVNEFRCPVCRRTNCLTCQVRNCSVKWYQGTKLTSSVIKNITTNDCIINLDFFANNEFLCFKFIRLC